MSEYVIRTIRDVVRAPKDPPRQLLWPESFWPRLVVLVVFVSLSLGLTGGSIAVYIVLYKAPPMLGALLAIVQTMPLLAAPRYPVIAFRVSTLAMLWGVVQPGFADKFMPWPSTTLIAYELILFAVAASYGRTVVVGHGIIASIAVAASASLLGAVPDWFGLIIIGMICISLAFGDAVGGKYSAERSLAVSEELRREDLAKQAVLEERSRIARELHDVVAHHMSVVALQAEAAPYKIPDLPDAAKDTFLLLRDEARRALTETRRVVGLLRSDSEAAERVPQPGLSRLYELADAHDGLSVDLKITGVPIALSDGIDLSAYRIVQEALSNAARHAPGSEVQVTVHYGKEILRISVRDNGARSAPDGEGGGHGLVGMRERVTMLGGSLFAGSQGNGWAVVAELPYDGEHDPRGDR